MAKIAKGKTAGQHQAKEAQTAANKPATPRRKGARRLSEGEVEQVKEALEELEETKGDWSKDR